MTDHKTLFKAAWDCGDAAAVLDVIGIGLREDGSDFADWLATHAARPTANSLRSGLTFTCDSLAQKASLITSDKTRRLHCMKNDRY
jgi:hypothetical protein